MFSRLVNTINYNNSRNIFHSVIGVVFSENSKRGNHGSCALRVFVFNHDSPYSYQQRSCVAMSRNEFTEDFGGVQRFEPTRAPHQLVARKSSITILHRQQCVNRIKQAVVGNECGCEPVLYSSHEDSQSGQKTYSIWVCKYKTDFSPSPVQSLTVYPCSLVLNGHAPFVRCLFDTLKCFGFWRI